MQDIRERLDALMDKGEGAEVEFKSARGGIPASLWESYSAFANTDGGIIVLGIQEKNGTLALDGLTEEAVTRYHVIKRTSGTVRTTRKKSVSACPVRKM